jgi:hypothetical protein
MRPDSVDSLRYGKEQRITLSLLPPDGRDQETVSEVA